MQAVADRLLLAGAARSVAVTGRDGELLALATAEGRGRREERVVAPWSRGQIVVDFGEETSLGLVRLRLRTAKADLDALFADRGGGGDEGAPAKAAAVKRPAPATKPAPRPPPKVRRRSPKAR